MFKPKEALTKIGEKKEGQPRKIWPILGISLIAATVILSGVTVVRAWPLMFKEKPADRIVPDEIVGSPDSPGQPPDTTVGPPPRVEKITVYEATASSYLVEADSEFDYSPAMAIDGDKATAWVESKADKGIGEWIKFEFLQASQISGLKIFPGYARDQDVYFKNGRLKKIQVEFSHDAAQEFDLADEYRWQEISFPAVTTDYVKITILDVWPGSKFTDTCLAEVEFIQ